MVFEITQQKRNRKQSNSENSEIAMCKNAMPKLVEAIKETGLTVIGSKSCGKSNAVKCIMKELSKDCVVVAIDFATNYAFELGKDFKVKFLNENYLIKKPKIDLSQNLIIDISQTSKNVASQIITELIKSEYYKRVSEVIQSFNEGKTERKLYRPWLIFALEETQSVIGSHLKEDNDLKTAMAVGRNYKINFIFITQRLSEIDTALAERSSYLIGKTNGDNNIRKLSSLLGISRRKLKFVETLQKGEFVFYNGERVEKVKFPLFNGQRVTVESEIIKRKQRNLWQRMKDAFKTQSKNSQTPNSEDTEEDFEEIEYSEKDYPDPTDADLIEFGL
jgi:hypothetical protein